MPGRYIKGWSKEHEAVFKLYIVGSTPEEIMGVTKLSMVRIRNIIRSQSFQEHKNSVEKSGVESARRLLEEKLLEAAGTIVRIMKAGKPDERLRFDAAKEVLYQCGLKPVEVVENRTRQYTPEEIQSSLETVKEIQTIEGTLSIEGSKFIVKREEGAVSDVTTEAPSEEAKVAD